jgi:hypothetical protein
MMGGVINQHFRPHPEIRPDYSALMVNLLLSVDT